MIDQELESLDDQIAFLWAVLDTLHAHIAIIDSQGKILAVNEGWRSFGMANGLANESFCVGVNYLTVCESAKLDPEVRTITKGIRSILGGSTDSFSFEYPCHSPGVERWFKMRARAVPGYPHFALVSHEDITERVVLERSNSRTHQTATHNRLEKGQRVRKLSGNHQPDIRTQPQRDPQVNDRSESLRILLVDDNENVRTMIERMLESLGHFVICAENSDLALSLLDERTPDVLITDLLMPGRLGGAELAQAARERLPMLPILIISGYADSAEVDFPLLAKPFRLQDLDAALRRLRTHDSS
ncbi:MAG: response regulator [Pseudomonadales bacterium]